MKTIKYKELDARKSQYICNQQNAESCKNCPLHIEIDKAYKLNGCFYLLNLELKSIGEKTITI